MALIPYNCDSIEDDIAVGVAMLRLESPTQGHAVPAFERASADRHEGAHAVAVPNATTGLQVGRLALGMPLGFMRRAFPAVEPCFAQTASLPLFSALMATQQAYVVGTLSGVLS